MQFWCEISTEYILCPSLFKFGYIFGPFFLYIYHINSTRSYCTMLCCLSLCSSAINQTKLIFATIAVINYVFFCFRWLIITPGACILARKIDCYSCNSSASKECGERFPQQQTPSMKLNKVECYQDCFKWLYIDPRTFAYLLVLFVFAGNTIILTNITDILSTSKSFFKRLHAPVCLAKIYNCWSLTSSDPNKCIKSYTTQSTSICCTSPRAMHRVDISYQPSRFDHYCVSKISHWYYMADFKSYPFYAFIRFLVFLNIESSLFSCICLMNLKSVKFSLRPFFAFSWLFCRGTR